MPKATNNIYTDESLSGMKLPKASECPYDACGDSLIIIPMEVTDDMPTSKLILTIGMGQTNKTAMRSRLIKGLVIKVGEGVATDNGFVRPEKPKLYDIVYTEIHKMKIIPFNYALIHMTDVLFIIDQTNPKAKEILKGDKEVAEKSEGGILASPNNGIKIPGME